MTPRTSRISPHTQSPHTIIDYLAALTNSRISSGRLRIPCPAHGGANPNLALWVNDDGIAARCHSAGCSYADIAAAIETRYGISINPRRHLYNPIPVAAKATSTTRTPEPGTNTQDLRPYALRLWHHAVPIPNSPNHPARLWLDARQLWRQELPLPAAVRWIDAKHLHRDYGGAGAVIAMAAGPTAWAEAWPKLPALTCTQLVYVAADGKPATDRGLSKRTYAGTHDAVVVLGCPLLDRSAATANVAEGLADALALAARERGTTIATLGTSGMLTDGELARYLATNPCGVEIYADRDEGKRGKAPAGLKAAATLRRHIEGHGGTALVCHASAPYKDPAEAAAHNPFPESVEMSQDVEEGKGNDTP